ncbi:MAG: DUF4360 domain-containing protein [Myxococcota bacterium]
MKNLSLWFLIFGMRAFAGEITIDQVVVGGSGCMPTTTETFLSSKHLSIRVEPEAYEVISGGRKTCMLVLPAHLSAQTKVKIASIEFKGQHDLSGGGRATIQAELFAAGTSAKPLSWSMGGASRGLDTVLLAPDDQSAVWSGCGSNDSTSLRINTSLLVQNGNMKITSMRIKLSVSPC